MVVVGVVIGVVAVVVNEASFFVVVVVDVDVIVLEVVEVSSKIQI